MSLKFIRLQARRGSGSNQMLQLSPARLSYMSPRLVTQTNCFMTQLATQTKNKLEYGFPFDTFFRKTPLSLLIYSRKSDLLKESYSFSSCSLRSNSSLSAVPLSIARARASLSLCFSNSWAKRSFSASSA